MTAAMQQQRDADVQTLRDVAKRKRALERAADWLEVLPLADGSRPVPGE